MTDETTGAVAAENTTASVSTIDIANEATAIAAPVVATEAASPGFIHEIVHNGLNELEKLEHFSLAEIKFLSQYIETEFKKYT